MVKITIHKISAGENVTGIFDVSVVKDSSTDESLNFEFNSEDNANRFAKRIAETLIEFNLKTN
tara:strand:+ start:583 stop:771 length:189 start_codon:yes stop_codon:yes gene_type:complete